MTDKIDDKDTNQKRPEATLRDGSVKASIWRNEGESGAFRATTFARTYEDRDGNPRDTHSFAGTDLLKVSELARQAYNKSRTLDREERRAAFKENRQDGERGPRQDRDR